VFTQRTLLIYNFGLALTFVVIGALSLFTFEHFLNRPAAAVPPFDSASSQAIHTEPDIEQLRSRAAFYFELGRELKRARYSDTDTLVRDFRLLCFLLGAAFTVGGAMSLVGNRKINPTTDTPPRT
jgi:hypothetical protein